MPHYLKTEYVAHSDEQRDKRGNIVRPNKTKCRHRETKYPDERFDCYRPDKPFTIGKAMREVMHGV